MASRLRPVAARVGLVNTKRAAILALVVCALALTVAAPLRTYVNQRSKIAEKQAQQRELSAELHRLAHRKQLLSDPHYVRTQARKRLLYVDPGATPYIVELPDHGAGATRGSAPRGGQSPEKQHAAWYDKLWTSLSGSGG